MPQWAGVAQSVQRLATDWTVRGSNPHGARLSAPVQSGSGDRPASAKGTGFLFPGIKRPGRCVDHAPHLGPRLKKGHSFTFTPPLCLHGLFYGKLYLRSFCKMTEVFWGVAGPPWTWLCAIEFTVTSYCFGLETEGEQPEATLIYFWIQNAITL